MSPEDFSKNLEAQFRESCPQHGGEGFDLGFRSAVVVLPVKIAQVVSNPIDNSILIEIIPVVVPVVFISVLN